MKRAYHHHCDSDEAGKGDDRVVGVRGDVSEEAERKEDESRPHEDVIATDPHTVGV